MKRVLVMIKGLGRGGAEQLLVSAAPYVDRDRFHYEFAYLLPHKDALVGELQTEGFAVHCLNGQRWAGWVGRLRYLVRTHRIDLVHVHSPYVAIGARVALRPRLPIVYTEHNLWDRYHRATYWGNMLTYPRNDHVFAVSDDVFDAIRYPSPLRFLPMPPLESLHHGIDAAAVARWTPIDGLRADLGIPADAPLVGMIANFKDHKRHDQLLRAALLVRDRVPDARFLLVGTGPLEEDVRRESASLGLNGTVVFAGFRDDAQRVTASLDVFTLSSTHEGLSIALLEAMALGRACVVTAVGGLPEVIQDGENGLLVPAENPRALADGIIAALLDPALRERLGQAARRRAADFDIRTAVRHVEHVYEGLLA